MVRTTSIPWRRVVTEGLVIVASILLAFAMDAGWDGRVERRAAVVTLENLRLEIADNIAAIDSCNEVFHMFVAQFFALRDSECGVGA